MCYDDNLSLMDLTQFDPITYEIYNSTNNKIGEGTATIISTNVACELPSDVTTNLISTFETLTSATIKKYSIKYIFTLNGVTKETQNTFDYWVG